MGWDGNGIGIGLLQGLAAAPHGVEVGEEGSVGPCFGGETPKEELGGGGCGVQRGYGGGRCYCHGAELGIGMEIGMGLG